MSLQASEIDQSRLFIIVGLARSGTTLLMELMNTFEGFCNNRESFTPQPDHKPCYWYVKRNNDFAPLENYIRNNWTKKYFVEKTPASITCLEQLSKHFPDANYIFLERHPLHVILSNLNRDPRGETFHKHMREAVNFGLEREKVIEKVDNVERVKAQRLFGQVSKQVQHKPLFKRQLTIRYESLIQELDKHIELLANTFKIEPNIRNARTVLARPSASSTENRYEIKVLSDPKAVEWINEAARLWGY